jgi:hypothetical protein
VNSKRKHQAPEQWSSIFTLDVSLGGSLGGWI